MSAEPLEAAFDATRDIPDARRAYMAYRGSYDAVRRGVDLLSVVDARYSNAMNTFACSIALLGARHLRAIEARSKTSAGDADGIAPADATRAEITP